MRALDQAYLAVDPDALSQQYGDVLLGLRLVNDELGVVQVVIVLEELGQISDGTCRIDFGLCRVSDVESDQEKRSY